MVGRKNGVEMRLDPEGPRADQQEFREEKGEERVPPIRQDAREGRGGDLHVVAPRGVRRGAGWRGWGLGQSQGRPASPVCCPGPADVRLACGMSLDTQDRSSLSGSPRAGASAKSVGGARSPASSPGRPRRRRPPGRGAGQQLVELLSAPDWLVVAGPPARTGRAAQGRRGGDAGGRHRQPSRQQGRGGAAGCACASSPRATLAGRGALAGSRNPRSSLCVKANPRIASLFS